MSVKVYGGIIIGNNVPLAGFGLERDITYDVEVTLDNGTVVLREVKPTAYQWPDDQEVLPVHNNTLVTVYDHNGVWQVQVPTPVPVTEECP